MESIKTTVRSYQSCHKDENITTPLRIQNPVCQPDCPICGGIGFVRIERPIYDPRFGKLDPCPSFNPVKTMDHKVGLTDKEKTLSYKRLIDRNQIGQATEIAVNLIQAGFGWLFLWGEFGLGKTTLLKTIIAECLQQGKPGAYTRMVDIIDDLRSAYATDAPNTESVKRLKFWTEIPILAIDEFDRIKLTEYAEERRFSLMDHRYEGAIRSESITIMASNSDPRKLDGYLADRIHDGRFKIIHLAGTSARPNMSE